MHDAAPTGRAKYAGVLISLASWAGAHAASADLPVTALDGFVDSYHQVLHAGASGILVGATTTDEAPEYYLQPAIYLPPEVAATGQSVCIEAASIDGAYLARGTISGNNLRGAGGKLRFQFADSNTGLSKFVPELRKIRPEQFAILAHLGDCDSSVMIDSSKVVVVDRSSRSSYPSDRSVRLYVNSGMASSVRVAYTTAPNQESVVECKTPLGSYESKVFNLVCEMPGPLKSVTRIRLIPVRYGRQLTSMDYDLIDANFAPASATGGTRR